MSRRDPETKHLSGRELRDYLRALREGGGERTSELAVDAPRCPPQRPLKAPARCASEPAPLGSRTGQPVPAATAFLAVDALAVGRPLLGGSAVDEAETSTFARPASFGARPASLDAGPASPGDFRVASEPVPKAKPKVRSGPSHAFSVPRERVIRAAIACAIGMGALASVAVQGGADHPSQANTEGQADSSGAALEAQALPSEGEPQAAHGAALAAHEAGAERREGSNGVGPSALAAFEARAERGLALGGAGPSRNTFAPAGGGARGQTQLASAQVHAGRDHGHAEPAPSPEPPPAAPTSRRAPPRAGGAPPRAEGAVGARQAVDLLLSGDTRAALDAYRALLTTTDHDEALQWAVRLLERELSTCPQGGGEPCIL